MPVYVLRSIIAVGAFGVCLWAIISAFIVHRNYRSTINKRTLAVFYLFIVIGTDYLWQFIRQFDQMYWRGDTENDVMLILKIMIYVLYSLAITNFMLRLYGTSFRRLIKRWLNDD
jgi:hypothetical protein